MRVVTLLRLAPTIHCILTSYVLQALVSNKSVINNKILAQENTKDSGMR